MAAALFWFTTYRKTMAMPPLWNLRAASLQSGAILDFVIAGRRRGRLDGVAGGPPPHRRRW